MIKQLQILDNESVQEFLGHCLKKRTKEQNDSNGSPKTSILSIDSLK